MIFKEFAKYGQFDDERQIGGEVLRQFNRTENSTNLGVFLPFVAISRAGPLKPNRLA